MAADHVFWEFRRCHFLFLVSNIRKLKLESLRFGIKLKIVLVLTSIAITPEKSTIFFCKFVIAL